jgi:hypothetical protein
MAYAELSDCGSLSPVTLAADEAGHDAGDAVDRF